MADLCGFHIISNSLVRHGIDVLRLLVEAVRGLLHPGLQLMIIGASFFDACSKVRHVRLARSNLEGASISKCFKNMGQIVFQFFFIFFINDCVI